VLPARGSPTSTLTGLAASPIDTSILYAATDDGVYRSVDAGLSWSRCSDSQPVLSVLVLQDGRTVLAGTSDGSVLRSADAGNHWVSTTRGIPGVKVSLLVFTSRSPHARLCRHGRRICGLERCRCDVGTKEYRPRLYGSCGLTDTAHRELAATHAGRRNAGQSLARHSWGKGSMQLQMTATAGSCLQSSIGTPWNRQPRRRQADASVLRRHRRPRRVGLAGWRGEMVQVKQWTVDPSCRRQERSM